MKPFPARRPGRDSRGGFILVIVLALLVLITALVIGFLGHTTSQTKSVTSYSAQTDSLLLGDVAVNLVKSQIDDATNLPTGNLWASQPGAIRVADGSGTQTLYKLYSSADLKPSAAPLTLKDAVRTQDLPSASDPNDWATSPLWTDLNAPAKRADGTNGYPIIDVVNDPADLPAATSFSVDNSTATNPIGATRTPVAGAANTFPLPMPVRWLYVLKQGQIIAPDVGASSTVTFTAATTQPTAANPIVGRIAFWTDDNTCRVNVNTAGHGTFWDTPHFAAPDDYTLASNQPVTKEYQRYAGHPATTTLSLALPEFTNNPEGLLALTPRYNVGGSKEGSIATTAASAIAPKYMAGSTSTPYRLFTSVDELLFDPPGSGTPRSNSALTKDQVETAKFFLTAHSRAPELNLFGKPRVAIWPVSSNAGSQYRTAADQFIAFCATTPAATSVTPGAIPNPYYFARAPYTAAPSATGSNSTSADVSILRNGKLLGYLDGLTSQGLPGNLGGGANYQSSTKYSQLGTRQILTEIFDYIRVTNSRDATLGSPLSSPVGVPYAAPSAYDTSQGSTGGYGQIVPTQYPAWTTYGYGRFQGLLVEASIIFVGVGQGIPANATSYATNPYNAVNANQVVGPDGVTYSATQAQNPSVATPPAPAPYIPPPGQTAVQAMLVLNFFDPAAGYARNTPYIGVKMAGLSGLSVAPDTAATPTSQSLFIRDTGKERLSTLSGAVAAYATMAGANPGSLGGLMDFRMMLGGRTFSNSSSQFPFYSNIINMPTGGTFKFKGTSFPITITVTGAGGQPDDANVPNVHQYTIEFKDVTLPVPAYSARPLLGSTANRSGTAGDWSADHDRFDTVRSTSATHKDSNSEYIYHLIDFKNDTIISMVPSAAYGDYRMLAQPVVPSNAFVNVYDGTLGPTPTATSRQAYGFMYPSGQTFQGSLHGKLVNGATYYNQDTTVQDANNKGYVYGSQPFVPVSVQNPTAGGVANVPPDFDNGFGELPDGPFINKPDEGAVYPANANTRVYYDNGGSQVSSQNPPASYFSPQRQVASPVMFGSLPTGAPVGGSVPKPWQTLLFQPGATNHPGLAAPKDEYLLDLFWMPQAEPYPISEPFSTAGKINLNYQILPFSYINRSTAIQSVLSGEKVAQVGAGSAGVYKKDLGNLVGGLTNNARLPLNLSETDGTLRQFAAKFQSFDFFKSAAEICDVFLVPSGESWTSDGVARSAWYDMGPTSKYSLVGDNTREKPYADIYSRITTQSNTFTVYYRAQTLKNTTANDRDGKWVENAGRIRGDYRGSTTLEHYIDPNDTAIVDYADPANTSAAGLAGHYKWRVVENTRFAP